MNKKPTGETFPPRAVCKALDIPHGTLSTWANRGWLDRFEAEAVGPGKGRQFTLADVLALALIKFSSEKGVVHSEIIGFAPDAAKFYLKHPQQVTRLIGRWYSNPSACTIRFNDEVMSNPAVPGEDFKIEFDLRAIFNSALGAIGNVTNEAPARPEPVFEKTKPKLPA